MSIYDTIYIFFIFILPLLGYVSSFICIPETGLTWYNKLPAKLPDIMGPSSYGLFFSIIIYGATGLGLVLMANYFLGINDLGLRQVTSRNINRIRSPLIDLNKIWEFLILMTIPVSFLILWITIPILVKYKKMIIPYITTVITSVLFGIITMYSIKIHWVITLLFLPLLFANVYTCARFYTVPVDYVAAEPVTPDPSDP